MALCTVLRGLSFSPGLKVKDEIWQLYGSPVTSAPLPGSFALVVSFGRCKFRLNEETISYILQATIGGIAAQFRVSELSQRVYKFFVSCQAVGFFVRRLIHFDCGSYKILFHLWGKGGPN